MTSGLPPRKMVLDRKIGAYPMKNQEKQQAIETAFRAQVQKDSRVRNAYLLVDSAKLGINLNIAEGKTGETPANPAQCHHMASVGKLFTATLISILFEQGKLDFEDPIAKYLDSELMDGLHVYKGRDYSSEITIRQLLMQSSGLNDVFYHLWKKLIDDPAFEISTREAVFWGKKHLKPVARPGQRHFYTDTNYYLLGMIIESICAKPFYKVTHEYLFEPLGMDHAYMHGYTKPKLESALPDSGIFAKGRDFRSIKGIHHIDHAGGSVIAPLAEFLSFIKALNEGRIIRKETLERMINDDIYMGFPTLGFDYGYSIWKFKEIPLLVPKSYFCWGCVGVTGAFMFFHPHTEAYIIGTFNDYAYRGKALEFMAKKVVRTLLKT